MTTDTYATSQQYAATLDFRTRVFIDGCWTVAADGATFGPPSTPPRARESRGPVDALSPATPFGGFEQSGLGRDLSLHSFDKYTGLTTTWIAYA
ncbi:hypothetical protein WDA79_06525 [Streptomyces sp. A475]|uniref:hypothetical protein n=1 Tax=Streptomyces sp. A475 TaxID=3131976 RepID=UPI0030C8F939